MNTIMKLNTTLKAPGCKQAQNSFPGYLDGAINGHEMQAVAQHLEVCAACKGEFAALRSVQQTLAAAGPVKMPVDLGLRLRVAISQEAARRQSHWYDSFAVRWQNLLQPLVLQASAGLAGALLLIGGIALAVGLVATPQSVLANDEPLGALTTPHYLYAAAPGQPVITPQDTTLVIQADINADGRVYNYNIVSGPSDAATDAQVRDQLMLLVYQPALAFGQPVRGQVLITFSGVSVRG